MRRSVNPSEIRYIVAPGQFLVDELEARETTFSEFAEAVGERGLTREALLSGAVEITGSLADKIAAYLQIPAYIWTGMEHDFRAGLAEGKTVLSARRTAHEDKEIREREFAKDDHLPQYEPESEEQSKEANSSGRISIRVPSSLRARASQIAKQEGISLNQLLLNYVAEGVGRSDST